MLTNRSSRAGEEYDAEAFSFPSVVDTLDNDSCDPYGFPIGFGESPEPTLFDLLPSANIFLPHVLNEFALSESVEFENDHDLFHRDRDLDLFHNYADDQNSLEIDQNSLEIDQNSLEIDQNSPNVSLSSERNTVSTSLTSLIPYYTDNPFQIALTPTINTTQIDLHVHTSDTPPTTLLIKKERNTNVSTSANCTDIKQSNINVEPNKERHNNIHQSRNIPFLQHHIRSRRKHLQCSYNCDKRFATKYELERHERVHTGERPYKCSFPLCGKAFRQKAHLGTHKRNVHGKVKLLQCHICDKQLKGKSTLARHIQYVHKCERKEYKCQYCERKFKRKGNLKSHLKKIHYHHEDIISN